MSGTSDPDGKIARENAERKVKEKKADEEKIAKRRKEKKAAEEKNAERRAQRKENLEKTTEGMFTVSASGTDIKNVTMNLIASASGIAAPKGAGFDMKA